MPIWKSKKNYNDKNLVYIIDGFLLLLGQVERGLTVCKHIARTHLMPKQCCSPFFSSFFFSLLFFPYFPPLFFHLIGFIGLDEVEARAKPWITFLPCLTLSSHQLLLFKCDFPSQTDTVPLWCTCCDIIHSPTSSGVSERTSEPMSAVECGSGASRAELANESGVSE